MYVGQYLLKSVQKSLWVCLHVGDGGGILYTGVFCPSFGVTFHTKRGCKGRVLQGLCLRDRVNSILLIKSIV